MPLSNFAPLVELTRGPLVESIHFGALAVVYASGKLAASCGSPELVANLRSSSKPFQALPLIEQGGAEHFALLDREISITCASHIGSDEHVDVLRAMQAKIGVNESDLQCGVHPSSHAPTVQAMLARGEEPTSNRHNCSGKHTGMLAQAVLRGVPIGNYLENNHPIQKTILQTFAELADMAPEDVLIGIDGCSAPTFAIPLHNAALAYARLCDPSGLSQQRASALRRIYQAMTTHPDMVAGEKRFDTCLMMVGGGMIVSKGGAEGYQAMGIRAGAVHSGSPAMGIAYKVIDGDPEGRARAVIGISILRQLGALNDDQLEMLKNFGPRPIYNWCKLEVGEIRPVFDLQVTAQKTAV
jgi:L-asparaginase II